MLESCSTTYSAKPVIEITPAAAVTTATPEAAVSAATPEAAVSDITATPTATPAPVFSDAETPGAPSVCARVLIDPGHGGGDYGAEVISFGLNEKDINLTIALRLYNLMRQDAGKVYVNMTRFDETTVSKPDRAEMANASYDFFISIHCNTCEVSAAHGVSSYFHTHETDRPFTSKKLAEIMQRSVVEATGAHDRGIVYDDELYLLNHTSIPAVIIEAGYLTNPDELNLLLDDSYIDKLAEGLRLGVLEMADLVIASRR